MVKAPKSTRVTIQQREDGYWIDRFQFHEKDKGPGLIVSGLNSGKVEYLENPLKNGGSPVDEYAAKWVHNKGSKSTPAGSDADENPTWRSYKIAQLVTPVPTASMDITGNGYSDVIVGYQFGETMIDCNPKGGKLVWFENPGPGGLHQPWTEHYIGRWPAMYRLATGYFTQRSFPEIIAAPVVHGHRDKHTPAPIICFQAPTKPGSPQVTEWRKDIVDDGHFRVIHEIYAKRFDGPSGLDTLIVASMEGVHWLYYRDGHWEREQISTGEPPTIGQRVDTFSPGAGDIWGTGSANAGRIGANSFAYVATIDPFHGPKVCVYTRNERGQKGNLWKRNVLDVYGTPAQKRLWGDGPGHQVICADIDGDGDDEFLVSLFGPLDRDNQNNPIGDTLKSGRTPNKGIICYKAIDLDKGFFSKWHIATRSLARCIIGDFMEKGRADVASVSYSVRHYYQEYAPKVTLYKNQLLFPSEPQIIGSHWSGEGTVYLPRPGRIANCATKNHLEVANFAISVEVYPPKQAIHAPPEHGIKPLYGWVVEGNQKRRVPLGGPPFPNKEQLSDPGDKRNSMKADDNKGAVILRLVPLQCPLKPGPWKKAVDVPVRNKFDISEQGFTFPELQFIKVEDLWWGGDFKGVDLYNMSGFHFRFLDDKQNIAHIKFWTAGPNVDARLHDHSDNAFKELHTCLSQGTPKCPENKMGGMWDPIPSTTNSYSFEPTYPPGYMHCALKPLQEHGRIWIEDKTGQVVFRKDKTVSYPNHAWHAGTAPEGYIDVWMALEFDAWLDF